MKNKFIILIVAGFLPGFLLAQTNSGVEVFTSGNVQLLGAKITDKATGKAGAVIRGFLTIPGFPFQMRTSVSDANGDIFFAVSGLHSSAHLIFETNPRKDSNYIFTVMKPPLHEYPGQKIIDSAIDYTDTLPFYGLADKQYLLDDYVRFPTLEEVFREYVPEARISKVRNDFRFNMLNTPYLQYFTDEPLVLLDGVPVFDYNQLLQIDPLKIKRLDVVARKYYYGSYACSGIISLISYDGDLAGYSLYPNALFMEYDRTSSSK